jgi:precorrin-6B methylase 2
VTEGNQTDVRLYNHAYEILKAHESMLGDVRRNRPFYRALKKLVRRDSAVVDIGAGTGVWAVAAAQLGAKRVVAIERDPLLIGLIKGLAHANHVGDRVEVLEGDSRQIALAKDFDLLVTETIGNIGFEEQIVSIVLDARKRFLKSDGAVIPESVTLVVAAAHLKTRPQKLPAGVPLDYGDFEALALHAPVELGRHVRFRIVSEPRDLIRTDLARIEALPDLTNLTACWQLLNVETVNCFAVWADATLTGGVRLSTLKTASWTPIFYRIRPLEQHNGCLEFKLTLTPETNYWNVILTNDRRQETQSYSPAFAAAELTARARTDAAAFDQLKRLGLLSNHIPRN